MAQNPLAMEQLKQFLQLHNDGISIREIARRTGASRNSVRKYLLLLNTQGNNPSNDREIADKAYNNDAIQHDADRMKQLLVHFADNATQLSRTGVTRELLWEEYLQEHPDGYSYSRYCHHLSDFFKNRDLSMHLEYRPGDMIMVDFAGKKQHYVDPSTGEQIECEVFVSIFPFSGLIFCHAVHSQQTADFIECINKMLSFYGGVPATILCDNLTTAVTRADRYEPGFTDMCHQLSDHYTTTFSATRTYRRRDKAMVERAVNIVYNHVYGPLRKTVFTSIRTLNEAMQQQLVQLNNKPYKNTPYSRRYYFEQQEQQTLKLLPSSPFTIKKVVMLTVQRNYHVQLSEDHRYYSVPFKYVGKKVKVHYDATSVEVYLDYERIAVHPRNKNANAYTTLNEHMPPHHQRMHQIKGWNSEDLLLQAERIGTATRQAASLMLKNSIYIEQNYKACFGMLMLQKKYSPQRLEAACQRALIGQRPTYTMIKNILERRLDQQLSIPETIPLPTHDNLRGKDHYQ